MALSKLLILLTSIVTVLVLAACVTPGGPGTGAGNGTQPGGASNVSPNATSGPPVALAGRVLSIINVTGPHVADGDDASNITVTVVDGNLKPVVNASVRVVVSAYDYVSVFNASHTGNGVYKTSVTSPYAGVFYVQAKDEAGVTSGPQPLTFTAGKVVDLKVVFSNPRLSVTGDESVITAWAVDKFGNIVPSASVSLNSNLGTMTTPVKTDDGRYEAKLSLKALGTATVTASVPVQAALTEAYLEKGESVTAGNYTATLIALGMAGGTSYAAQVQVQDAFGASDTAVINEGSSVWFFNHSVKIEFVTKSYEPGVGDTARLKTSVGEASPISKNVNIVFPLFFIDAGQYAVKGDEYPATLYLYVPNNALLGYYSVMLNYNPQVLNITNATVIVPNELWKPEYYLGTSFVHFYKSFNSSSRPPKQIVEVAKLNFAVVGTGTVGLEAWLFDNNSASLADANESKIVPDYSNAAMVAGNDSNVTIATGGLIWAGEAKIKPTKPICVKVWDVNNSITEEEFVNNNFAKLKEIFGKLVKKSCPKFAFSYKWNTLNSANWSTISGGDGDIDSDTWADIERLFSNRDPDCINTYYVPAIAEENMTAFALSPKNYPGQPNRQGIILDKRRKGNNTAAHEVGHYLGLSHDEYEKNASGDVVEKMQVLPDGNKTSVEVSNNTNLMYPIKEPGKFDLDEIQCAELARQNP